MSDYGQQGRRVIAGGDVEPRHSPAKAISADVWKRLPAAIAASALAIGKPLAVYLGDHGTVAYALDGRGWPGMRYLGTYGRGTTEAQVAADLRELQPQKNRMA